MQWSMSDIEFKSFQTFVIVFSTPENLLVGITRTLGMKESHFQN